MLETTPVVYEPPLESFEMPDDLDVGVDEAEADTLH